MKLAAYLTRHALTHREFARRSRIVARRLHLDPIHFTEVGKYAKGQIEPRAGKVAVIESITGGRVKARDLAIPDIPT